MPVPLDSSALQGKLHGKVAIVTGGAKNIGFATAYELLTRGCRVVITSRTKKSGAEAAEMLRHMSGRPSDAVDYLELISNGPLVQLKTFVQEFKKKWDRLDIIIFNAGTTICISEKTCDNLVRWYVERLVYQHILLAQLWDLLTRSGSAASPSRVITTTGFAYGRSNFLPEEWFQLIDHGNVEGSRLDFPAFCVAQVGWTRLLAEACDVTETPVRFFLTHPGFVVGSGGCKNNCLLPAAAFCLGYGSHTAKDACLPNVAACVLPTSFLSGSSFGFVGPEKTTYGRPAMIHVDKAEDKVEWRTFSCDRCMWGIGKITLEELSVKIEIVLGELWPFACRPLEKLCYDAKLMDKRYEYVDDEAAPPRCCALQ